MKVNLWTGDVNKAGLPVKGTKFKIKVKFKLCTEKKISESVPKSRPQPSTVPGCNNANP